MKTFVKKTKYWHKTEDGRIQCDLCPRSCVLNNGQRGFCFVRGCEKDEVVLYSYGLSTGLAVDPVEKKPLYHFFPGSSVLSFGTNGCNLVCRFCQNWQVSHSKLPEASLTKAMPVDIVKTTKAKHLRHIAFTYNDPVVFLEYAKDVAELAHAEEINTVAVTAGYISDKARETFFSFIDAANVDLKAFSNNFYKKYTGARLQPVLDTLKYIKQKTNIWLEVTTLLIPGLNDSDTELHEQCEWMAEHLGINTPIHFSAFHPAYKMNHLSVTPLASLRKARDIAITKGFFHVYTGNVHDREGSATWCPNCKQLIIERDYYRIVQKNLDSGGRCVYCHTNIAGRF